MSQAEQGRNEVVIYRLEKARTTLKEAKDNIMFKSWSLIANRLFYAAYYAVSGLLTVYGHRVKSHEGTVSQFGQYFVTHLPTVRTVHGKGTGALRNAVTNHLKRVSYVAKYRAGEFGEGDSGVTIVEFK